ncbi:MAG TPA: hypothetical protein VGR32_07200 [Brevundimonas sp.]|jgi:hypothetical protein|uniref:hypothetical protein n=1 Tax=Brevundimonas sp. TaxID=1871086 RepID=UPI002DF5261C|nr:hypothetical protein [Brevundimonas sp.]
MKRAIVAFLAVILAAGPALADVRLWSYDAADRVTRALTQGLTFEVRRGLFGAVSVLKIHATTSRGSAEVRWGGPPEAVSVLPAGARERDVYQIVPEGEGRGLVRALCPSAEQAWLVMGHVRAGRPLTMHAVGRWADGRYRHCVQLNYAFRGDWTAPDASGPVID